MPQAADCQRFAAPLATHLRSRVGLSKRCQQPGWISTVAESRPCAERGERSRAKMLRENLKVGHRLPVQPIKPWQRRRCDRAAARAVRPQAQTLPSARLVDLADLGRGPRSLSCRSVPFRSLPHFAQTGGTYQDLRYTGQLQERALLQQPHPKYRAQEHADPRPGTSFLLSANTRDTLVASSSTRKQTIHSGPGSDFAWLTPGHLLVDESDARSQTN